MNDSSDFNSLTLPALFKNEHLIRKSNKGGRQHVDGAVKKEKISSMMEKKKKKKNTVKDMHDEARRYFSFDVMGVTKIKNLRNLRTIE